MIVIFWGLPVVFISHPENGGSRILQNIGAHPEDCNLDTAVKTSDFNLTFCLLQTLTNVRLTMEVVNMSVETPLVHIRVPAIMVSCCMTTDMTVRREAASTRSLHLLEPSHHPIILTTTQAGRTVFGISLLLQDIESGW